MTDDNINMFASPAPYVISLALFVGILILSFFVEFKKPAILPGSASSWYVSKWLQLAIFTVLQALLVSLFTLVMLKLSVSSVPLFILFTIFVSLTFMSIVFFLVTAGGHIGRFVAFAFIILQLSTTGSNLPIPMLPEGLQALSKFLPLTYSNGGFKAVISLGDTALLQSNTLVLLIYLIVSSVLAFIVFLLSYPKISSDMSNERNVDEPSILV